MATKKEPKSKPDREAIPRAELASQFEMLLNNKVWKFLIQPWIERECANGISELADGGDLTDEGLRKMILHRGAVQKLRALRKYVLGELDIAQNSPFLGGVMSDEERLSEEVPREFKPKKGSS